MVGSFFDQQPIVAAFRFITLEQIVHKLFVASSEIPIFIDILESTISAI
jgi:hypothetical protein